MARRGSAAALLNRRIALFTCESLRPGFSRIWMSAALGLGKSDAKRALGTPTPLVGSNTSSETNWGLLISGTLVRLYLSAVVRAWRRNCWLASCWASCASFSCLAFGRPCFLAILRAASAASLPWIAAWYWRAWKPFWICSAAVWMNVPGP